MAQAFAELDDELLASIAERRLALRVPLSVSVTVRDGLRSRRAALLDLSLTGARLRFEEPVTADRRPWLWLPAGFGGRLAHPIGSEVAWTDSVPGAPTGHCYVGIHFRRFPLGGRRRLRRAIAELMLRVAEAQAVPALEDRRTAPRVAYERRVIARGAGAPLVMLGRDISRGGLRVETSRALAVGDTMQLALHLGGSVPLVVRAEVVRAIDEGGWALAFRGLDAAQQARIDSELGGPHVLLISELRESQG
jgi:hypothetical protein